MTERSWQRETQSPDETQAVAAALGRLVEGGEVFALQGDLGAGKTCFVQGLARGLEVPEETYVRSPTFSLLESYTGRLPIFHLDLYRLEESEELEAIGWRECLDGEAVVLVEWADQLEDYLPAEFITIAFAIGAGDTRTLTLTPEGSLPRWWALWLQESERLCGV